MDIGFAPDASDEPVVATRLAGFPVDLEQAVQRVVLIRDIYQ